MEDKLRLNLQFFSEEDGNPNESDIVDNDLGNDADGVNKPDKQEVEKKFTQDDIDRIVKDRLARAKKDADEAAEKARLEEQGQYKELLDKANEEIELLRAEKAKAEREQSINSKLLAKGLTSEEVIKYSKYVDKLAETDEELDTAIEDVYNDFVAAKQAAYKDPNAGFGGKKESEQKGDDEVGRELFNRLGR